MKHFVKRAATAALLLCSRGANSQDPGATTGSPPDTTTSASACATTLTPAYSPPVVAPGWKAQLIATGLNRPRGIKFDTNGALLVVEAGVGISRLEFEDGGGTCLSVKRNTTLHRQRELNHGIELSPDGRTLYASTQEFVYAWDYDPGSDSLSNRRILVQNMTNPGGGHNTRTLLLSRKQPDLLLVSRGSAENIDQLAALEASGISQIRAFNVSGGPQPYSYPSDGILVGWGLRNSVGVAEHPETGGLWSVENSADDVARLGRDIHEDNPGEELNFHGRLADAATLGANHGYPHCFALWNTTGFPRLGNLTVGDQFALLGNDTAANTTASVNDTTCAREYTAPRLTFTAHMAPLDIKFEPSNSGGGGGGRRAFVTFHGSWNREVPAGYKLSYVDFSAETGEPVEPADSVSAAVDVLWSPDLSACPRGCVRPVGLAFDTAGEDENDENDENDDGSSSAGGHRLFVTSDSAGEIWVVVEEREEPTPTSSGADGASTSTGDGGDGGGSGSGEPDSTSSAAAPRGMYRGIGRDGWVMIGLTLAVAVAGGFSLVVGGL